MPYGDSGVGKSNGPFAKLLPWTVGHLVGTDGGGRPKTVDVQYATDTGVSYPAIAAAALMGFQVVFLGVQGAKAHGVPFAVSVLKGVKLEVQADSAVVQGKVDFNYNDLFALLTDPALPSIIGGHFWDGGAVLTVNIKAGTVKIVD